MTNNFKFLTFLYHDVVDKPSDSGFQRKSALPYKHKITEFQDNIDIIVSDSKPIISINELYLHNKAILLTFDDGGKSAILIADYLEKYNLKGHFFITTSLIGDKYFLKEHEVLELHQRGHIIGSHSHSHPNVFSSITYEEMMKEWSQSKCILEKIVKCNINSCSIPGGDANKNAYYSAKECGYKFIFNSEITTKPRRIEDVVILGRICPKQGTNYESIKGFIKFKGIRKEVILRLTKKIAKIILYPIYSKIYNARIHKTE